MTEEKNQATKPCVFDSPMQELHCGIKIQANRGSKKFNDLLDKGLSQKLLKSEDDEDEENQRYATLNLQSLASAMNFFLTIINFVKL